MATLRVIDAASHQGDMNQSAMDFDALIVKATEGTTYVNPYCDGEFQEAYKLGKCLGVYHFARNANGNSADAEANFFIENTKGYIGKAIPVLDWEDSDTSNVAWALRWLQLVEKAYGCKPMIYMSESVANRYDWSSVANGDYGLWCAKYRDTIPDYNWDMASAGSAPSVKYWKTIALWQWTSVGRLNGYSGNLDCSIFYGDRDAWNKYVGNGSSSTESSKLDLAGKWIKDKVGWWWKNPDGSYPKNCWGLIDGDYYYFGKNGYALANQWLDYNGNWYWLNSDCRMAKGWKNLGGIYYYFNEKFNVFPVGAMVYNLLITLNGKKYYLTDSGYMAKNETLKISGREYTFNGSGEAV